MSLTILQEFNKRNRNDRTYKELNELSLTKTPIFINYYVNNIDSGDIKFDKIETFDVNLNKSKNTKKKIYRFFNKK